MEGREFCVETMRVYMACGEFILIKKKKFIILIRYVLPHPEHLCSPPPLSSPVLSLFSAQVGPVGLCPSPPHLTDLVLCPGWLALLVPALARVEYERLQYEDSGPPPHLQGSSRLRRDAEGSGEVSFEYSDDEDDDEDYFSSTELLPSRAPGIGLYYT